MALRVRDYLLMLGMLLTGSLNTVSKKVQLDCTAYGNQNRTLGDPHKFRKPWLQTLLMFIGESFCLMGFAVIRWKKQRKERSQNIPPTSSLTKNSYFNWIFIIPTMCDMLGTTIAGYSLLYIDASVWQMMRGSLIVFVGLLSMIFLKRFLRLFHWTGISVTVIGLTLVGLSSVLRSTQAADKTTIIGILLVIAASLVSASQMVLEEALLKKQGFHPLQVVGSEGIVGTIVTGFIVLPVLYYIKGTDYGSVENVVDGLYMISQNPLLLVNVIIYTLSIAFYNYFGLSVARNLTAVHRTLIDALRTVLVWVVSLVIYYSGATEFGEKFDKDYGLLQIDGFAFLMIGTMIYNRVMNLDFIPFCRFEETAQVDEKPVEGTIKDDDSETAPLIN